MDSTTAGVTTMVGVTAGRWAQGKGLEAKVVIGAGFYALFLSVVESSQPKFAGQLAALVLVTALLIYMIPIAKSLNLITNADSKYAPVTGLGPMTGTR
jgi:hypothetical protein